MYMYTSMKGKKKLITTYHHDGEKRTDYRMLKKNKHLQKAHFTTFIAHFSYQSKGW